MKKKNILLALTGLLFLFAGCSDDDIVEQPSAFTGHEVLFGVSTNSVKTGRTSYTGNIVEGYEGVNWEADDKVRLFSPQSANVKFSDYTLQAITNQNNVSTTSLVKVGNAGLQWGNVGKHDFYGIYPSPLQYLHNGVDVNNVLQSTSTFIGYIPKNQFPTNIVLTTGTNAQKKYVCKPNMDYAYMAAKTSTAKIGEAVRLSFAPFVTTLTLSVKNATKTNTPISLNGISVSSKGKDGKYLPVYGKFEADLSQISMKNDYPTVKSIAEHNVEPTSIYVSLVNKDKQSLTLNADETVEFTVFLLPNQTLDNIELTLHSGAAIKRGLITGIQIQQYKKNFVRNIPIDFKVDVSNWITYLPDDALVNQLSIPGAGGVGGHLLTEDLSKEQTLDVTKLWNQGIRAFEFSIDRPGSNNYADFFNKPLICNGIETSLTFSKALEAILDPLSKNRGEFAMVIINYQPISHRNADEFMAALKTCWERVEIKLNEWNNGPQQQGKIKLGTKLYEPATTTVGESRGKLFCIARPTSRGEDDYDTWGNYVPEGLLVKPENVHPNILVINGWGSLKDKWAERGYTPKKKHGNGKADDGKPLHPFYYMQSRVSEFTIDPMTLNYDFTYDVQAGASSVPNAAWVQEWPRVSKGTFINHSFSFWKSYWANTFDEKKQRVLDTFDKTMYQTSVGQNVFINSLCGYFVDQNIPSSYTPFTGTDNTGESDGGVTGNVRDYATAINDFVYGTVFQHGLDDVAGPLGIVLMDRVGNDATTSPANTNLPYLIISNNFRFDMTLKPGGGSNPEGVDVRSARTAGHYDFIFDASANH